MNYDGVLYASINFINSIRQKMWMFLHFEKLYNWISSPYNIPSYLPDTDEKFQRVERNDCLFVNNTKDFFIIYLPFLHFNIRDF